MSRIIHLLSADIDVQNAYEYYEDLVEGRGAVFMRKLNAAYGLIIRFPESGRLFKGTYRRLLVSDFPYAIYYTLYSDRIMITAVLDIRQRPETILRRLG